jgi:hypothetical protein
MKTIIQQQNRTHIKKTRQRTQRNTQKRKNKDKAKNANDNKIMIPLKEIKTIYVLNSAAGGQLQSQYGT